MLEETSGDGIFKIAACDNRIIDPDAQLLKLFFRKGVVVTREVVRELKHDAMKRLLLRSVLATRPPFLECGRQRHQEREYFVWR